MFEIEFTPEAIEDIHQFRKYDQHKIIEGIENQLTHQATQETRNRKKLRPNQIAEWELRIDNFRVFYDINKENMLVKIEAVGYKKGSQLFIHGEEYQL